MGVTRPPHIRLFQPDGPSAQRRRVCVMGLGYIGLPTSAILAEAGYDVVGVDVQQDVVDTVNAGRVHIVEPGLPELVREMVSCGRLRAQLTPVEADVFIICVPTPIAEDKTPNLTYVRNASAAVAPLVRRDCLIILESTSPPNTTKHIVAPIAVRKQLSVGTDVFVAHCPERVIPGLVLDEVKTNDRVVGGVTDACAHRAKDFYESFVDGTVTVTRAIVAELTKLVENAHRDVNIAFANELSMLAERFGADPIEVIEIANRHPRVNILNPGPGVGGQCIGVDPWFLVYEAPKYTPLIRTARQVNDAKPEYVVQRVLEAAAQSGARTIGCLGLSYKADVDNLYLSPSLEIVRRIRSESSAEVLVCDPYFDKQVDEIVLSDLDAVLDASDLLVLLTDHAEFKRIDRRRFAGRAIIDTRGAWRGSDSLSQVRKAA